MAFSKRYYKDSVGTDSLPTATSAATLVLPAKSARIREEEVICYVSGTADITSISATGEAGTKATLIFTGTAATNGVVDGNNLKLTANLVYSPDDVLDLICDGTNWYERGRNAN